MRTTRRTWQLLRFCWGVSRTQLCRRKWNDINQSLGGFTGYEGTRSFRGSGSELYTEEVLRHQPKCATSSVTELFVTVLGRQYLPPAWKYPRLLSTVKPGKDYTRPSSCRTLSLLDTLANSLRSHTTVFGKRRSAVCCGANGLCFDAGTALPCSWSVF
jgi:hypothetical protein